MDNLMRGVFNPRGCTPLRNPGQHSPLRMKNRVEAEVWGPDAKGEVVLKQKIGPIENIMATYGLNRLSEMMVSDAGGASAFCNVAAIGTDTTAASSTQNTLGASTQLASGASFSRSDAGSMTAQYNLTFASNGNACQVHEIGLFQTNQATASCIARSVLGTNSINRGTADEIRATYQVICGTA